jgi:hypothetical protein
MIPADDGQLPCEGGSSLSNWLWSVGGGSEVAARALSLPDLQASSPGPALPAGLEPQETSAIKELFKLQLIAFQELPN